MRAEHRSRVRGTASLLTVGIMLVTLVASVRAPYVATPGWPTAIALGSGAVVAVAVVAAQVPGSLCQAFAPRASWLLALVAALVTSVAYDPLLDPTCPLSCGPLPGELRVHVDQQDVRVAAALLVAGSALLRLPRRWVRPSVAVPLAVSVVLALLPWWGRATGVAVPVSASVVAVGIACLSLVVSNAQTVLRRRRARLVAAALGSVPLADDVSDDVLRELGPAARLALTNARLEVASQARAQRLRLARNELVAALDAERARVGADLHDLVQQRLVGVLLHTRALAAAPGVAPARRDQLMRNGDRLNDILDQMRGLADPGKDLLGDSVGLATAVRARFADTAIDVTVADVGDLTQARRHQAVAIIDSVAAAAGRHEGGRLLRIDLARDGGDLVLTLFGWTGSLPLGVRDRVDAAGGRCRERRAVDGAGEPTARSAWTEVRLPCVS